jgi:hypothetical protein
MPEVVVKLPRGFRFLNQFSPSQWAQNPSKYRCAEASVAMATEFARPGSHIPEHLMDYLYVKYIGPDDAGDQRGTNEAQLEEMLKWCQVTFVNLQALVDEFSKGDRTPLHAELMAMNNQNVMQIITVADESKLYDAVGKKLHAWNDEGMSHVMTRVGYSTDEGYGLYGEPAAVGFAQPVRIPWQRIIDAGIVHAWGILAEGVPMPPAGFLFQRGTWPAPKPATVTLSQAELEQALSILEAALTAQTNSLNAIKDLLKTR